MTVFKYDHVHPLSPDPEATAQFYENMFGAEVSRSLYPAGTALAGQPRITMKLAAPVSSSRQPIREHPTATRPRRLTSAWNTSA